MRRFLGVTAVTLLCVGVSAPASAVTVDRTNLNYRSNITGVVPRVPGLSLRIIDFNDELELTNNTGRTVTVLGYEGEPFARILADGTVQVNVASPAYYLNQAFYANVTVPATASSRFPPRWSTLGRSGRFQWHDHRIHWMSPVTPPQVKDKSRTTKIFDWQVPIRVGPKAATIQGNLFWVGLPGGPFPVWAIISLLVVVPPALIFSYRAQVRRAKLAREAKDESTGEPPREAW